MKLIGNTHHPLCKRIKLFLGYKNIPVEIVHQGNVMNPILQTEEKEVSGDTIDILREIEYAVPHPIGFIGPVESRLQWANMMLSTTPGYQEILEGKEISEEMTQRFAELFKEIEEHVEDEYFVMGPTFSVADCVLAADLEPLQKSFSAFPHTLTNYITRVQKRCC